jgi:hypothetical protein
VEIEVRGEPLEDELLSLRKLPALFRRARERVHLVEKTKCGCHERCGVFSANSRAASSAIVVIAQNAAAASRLIIRHGLVDVRIGALRNFPVNPNVHLNHAKTVLPIKDGLPKLKDFPAAIGSSGETMPE